MWGNKQPVDDRLSPINEEQEEEEPEEKTSEPSDKPTKSNYKIDISEFPKDPSSMIKN